MKFRLLVSAFILMGLHACNRAPLQDNIIHSVVFHEVSASHLHGPCVSPDYFRDVLQMIRIGNKRTLFASEIVDSLKEGCLPSDCVFLSFDDGWSGVRDYAHPLLDEFDMKGTFFVATSCIDSGRPRYCNWSDLTELFKSKRWEIHSHSVTHADFVEIDCAALVKELRDSFDRLNGMGFTGANTIAYPYGRCNSCVEKKAKSLNYRAGFIAGPNAWIRPDTDIYAIPRTTICQLFDQELVCCKLGLDVNEIRRTLSTFDEGDGFWNEACTLVNGDSGTPCGLYGNSYIKANARSAKWWIDIPIEISGRCQFSVWTPVILENGEIETDKTGYWRIYSADECLVSEGPIPSRTKNGWTQLTALDCRRGSYRVELVPQKKACELFIVDALKVERALLEFM